MKERDLREVLSSLEVEVVHKNPRGWLVCLLACIVCPFTLSQGMQFAFIPQNPNFEISEDGSTVRRRVASRPQGWGARLGKPISFRRNEGRYFRVKLEGKLYQVHVLVCSAFHGEAPEGKPMALHKDDCPHSNHFSNLYWGDRADNLVDARRNGRILAGETSPVAKLTWAKVDELRSLKGVFSERELARQFGIPRPTINWVLSGRSWNEATRPI